MTEASASHTVHLRVVGMMCQKSCGTTVQNALLSVPGVESASASFADNSASATGTMEASALIDAVECVGFEASVATSGSSSSSSSSSSLLNSSTASVTPLKSTKEHLLSPSSLPPSPSSTPRSKGVFRVGGMSCAACVGKIERTLEGMHGVGSARVALLADRAEVFFDPSITSAHSIERRICGLGFEASHITTEDAPLHLPRASGRPVGAAGIGAVGVRFPRSLEKRKNHVTYLRHSSMCTVVLYVNAG